MRRVGRRNGFLTGGVFGLVGAVVACAAMFAGSLPLLCLGTMLLGVNNAFGQYYRFAAADVAGESNADFKATRDLLRARRRAWWAASWAPR